MVQRQRQRQRAGGGARCWDAERGGGAGDAKVPHPFMSDSPAVTVPFPSRLKTGRNADSLVGSILASPSSSRIHPASWEPRPAAAVPAPLLLLLPPPVAALVALVAAPVGEPAPEGTVWIWHYMHLHEIMNATCIK